MAISYLAIKQRLFVALLASIITPTVIAGFIYTWQDSSPDFFNVSGMIGFSDEINFGDLVDTTASIAAFDFLITDSSGDFSLQFGRDDIAINVPFLVNPGGLNDSHLKVAKKKAAPGPLGDFDLINDQGFLGFDYFDQKKKAKKKATKKKASEKGGGAPVEVDLIPLIFTDWIGTGGAIFTLPDTDDTDTGEVKKKAKKKAAKKIKLSIEGQWALASSLPEPASFGLMLIGLFAIGGWWRRLR